MGLFHLDYRYYNIHNDIVIIHRLNSMTQDEMRQKASEARREAKALQKKMQTVTDSEERKVIARQMNELFAQAASLRDEAKHRHYQAESIERDFRCMETNLED